MADNKMLHTKAEVLRENIKVEEGVIESIVGSTSVLDRMGDIIDQAGWDIKNFLKNPVILWGHNVHEERPPIGRATRIWKGGTNKKNLMFSVKFDLQDSFAAEIFRKIKDGFINTVSVGFLPVEWEELDKNSGAWGGKRYTKQELLELSFVPVPANPEAVVALRGMHDKRFDPVELDKLYPQEEKEEVKDEVVKEETEVLEVKDEVSEESISCDGSTSPSSSVTMPEAKIEVPVVPEVETTPPEEEKKEETVVEPETTPPVEAVTEEPKVEAPKEEVVVGPPKEEPKTEEPVKTEEVVEEKTCGAIAFEDFGIASESEGWDGQGEIAKADLENLKLLCSWYNKDNSNDKSSYKLIHHKAEDKKCVWRGVAVSMALLLGAKGGVEIPETDKEAVYNHLKEHYIQFGKQAPDFKMVEEQVLSKLDEELLVLALERAEKYEIRLIKKVLKNQNENKTGYTEEQVAKALKLIDLTLSLYENKTKGGENK